MNDDELITRMRAALDEVATTPAATDDIPVVPQPAARGRWMAVAAAAVLLAGGVAAIALNRGDHVSTTVTAPAISSAATIFSMAAPTPGSRGSSAATGPPVISRHAAR